MFGHTLPRAYARRRVLVAVMAVMVPMAGLAAASPAFAKEPTGDFAVFKQCPRFTSEVRFCLYSQVTGGKVTINKQTVPIENTITLQGGIKRNPETEVETFVGALNGETLSKTPQNVPGGLLGLINCTEIKGSGFLEVLAREACKAVFENEFTGVRAITELARPASEIGINKRNLIEQEGAALSLPVKVRLENPLLGSECYVGSSASPLDLNLTTGTTKPEKPNTPIMGESGEIREKDGGTFVEIPDNILVNNEFSAPEASGCGGIFAFLLDPLINSKIGLPAADGLNTAIQDTNIFEATGEAVIKSEK